MSDDPSRTDAPPPEDDPDAALVALARRGERLAQRDLVQRHRAALERLLASRYLKNPDDAAEITQDAFARAFQRIDTFSGQGPFRAWLFRIGINLALNHLRHEVEMDPLDVEDDRLFTNSLGTSRLVAADLRRRVSEAIARLPPKQRLVMELRIYHQMTFEEVATVAGISVDSAKVNFQHALRRLRSDAPEE
jgi:RNA polymerase sigma-70 factor (ECF subfamily)